MIVSPFEEDHLELPRILSDSQWQVSIAHSLPQAWLALHGARIDVILTETDFPDGLTWRDLLEEIENMHGTQPVIVTSAFADGRLWAEVLNLGAYDLLMKPFDVTEVLRVLGLAARQARYQRAVGATA